MTTYYYRRNPGARELGPAIGAGIAAGVAAAYLVQLLLRRTPLREADPVPVIVERP